MNTKEKDIYERLTRLRSESSGALHSNPFASLIKRLNVREQFEKITSELLDIIKDKETSSLAGLKVLEIMELTRARDIGLQIMRLAPIGKPTRPKWSVVKSKTFSSLQLKQLITESRAVREFRQSAITLQKKSFNDLYPDLPDLDLIVTNGNVMEMMDFSKTLVLHLGLVDDMLVTALDANLGLFIYGNAINSSDRIVQSDSFRDYGYISSELDSKNLIYGPNMKRGIRDKLHSLVEEMHKVYDHPNQREYATFFKKFALSLDELIDYEGIRKAIESWAITQRCNMQDICLVIVPDDCLFLLPLSFLGSSHGEPFITLLGGVSVALSLLCLKWAVSNYHWTTCKGLSSPPPKCGLFYAKRKSFLNLEAEVEAVTKGFGEENCRILGPDTTLAEFHSYYTTGEICWFAGHGRWDLSKAVNIEGKLLPFPISGPCLADGELTNWDLITSSNWNFKPLWLTVLNSCVIGKSIAIGLNPIGFMSALHSAGCIAAVSALFPIFDDVAIDFAANLSTEINKSFGMLEFPRARALSSAIRKCLEGGKSLWQLAPYALWGLP